MPKSHHIRQKGNQNCLETQIDYRYLNARGILTSNVWLIWR